MKAVLALLFIALAVALVSAQTRFDIARTDTREMFQEWQDYHVKSYATAEETDIKYANFLAAIEHAKKLNEESNSTSFGVTMFSDMTIDEWKAKYLMDPEVLKGERPKPTPGFVKRPAPIPIPSVDSPIDYLAPQGYIPGGSLPNTLYDWQFADCVTPVYNQGGCGSCWAFSVMEQLESDYAFQHNLSASQLTAEGTYPLSVQELVDCDVFDGGCAGGTPGNTYLWLIYRGGGLMTNQQYPYTQQNGNCQQNGYTVSISSWDFVYGGDYGLLQGLITGGPLSVCIDALPFFSYTNGIIMASACHDATDHCLQLTGYQTDANGQVAAWNVRNQWGTGFGINGYAMLQYGIDTCYITNYATQVNAN